jgi:endonuclease/exonuclease/phosphatase family metal-dependent hydrolase
VARLDHALVNDAVHPVRLTNLDARGSDHVPFTLRLAIRPDQRARNSIV